VAVRRHDERPAVVVAEPLRHRYRRQAMRQHRRGVVVSQVVRRPRALVALLHPGGRDRPGEQPPVLLRRVGQPRIRAEQAVVPAAAVDFEVPGEIPGDTLGQVEVRTDLGVFGLTRVLEFPVSWQVTMTSWCRKLTSATRKPNSSPGRSPNLPWTSTIISAAARTSTIAA